MSKEMSEWKTSTSAQVAQLTVCLSFTFMLANSRVHIASDDLIDYERAQFAAMLAVSGPGSESTTDDLLALTNLVATMCVLLIYAPSLVHLESGCTRHLGRPVFWRYAELANSWLDSLPFPICPAYSDCLFGIASRVNPI